MNKADCNGVLVNYTILDENTENTPVVLVHGLGANMSFWYMDIAKKLAKDRTIVMYDLRGHGYSDMPESGYDTETMEKDLSDLLKVLKVSRYHLVGHSYGAGVCILNAFNNKNNVASLTIADTQLDCLQSELRLKDWKHWERWKQDLIENRIEQLPSDESKIDFELLQYLNTLKGKIDGISKGKSLKRLSLKNKGSKKWKRLLEETTARDDFEDQSSLTLKVIRGIESPILCLYGELSHCLPTSRRIKEIHGNSTCIEIEGLGHFHPSLNPKRFTKEVQSFIVKHEGRGQNG